MAAAAAPSAAVNAGLSWQGQPGHAQAITKSDSTTYIPTRALYVGGVGDVAVTMAGDGNDVTFVAVPTGTVLHVRAIKILSTGTSATNIVAMW